MAIIREVLGLSDLTADNVAKLPDHSPLKASVIYDSEFGDRVRQVVNRILGSAEQKASKAPNAEPVDFQLEEFIYKNEGGGWNKQLTIWVDKDRFLFCYAVVVLDFVHKYSSYLESSDMDRLRSRAITNPCISVIQEATTANSETELKKILESRDSMSLMVEWLKELAIPGVSYDFNEESLSQIKMLFEKVGLVVNVAKEGEEDEDYFFITGFPKDKPFLKDIYIEAEACAELVLNNNGTITYFSNA